MSLRIRARLLLSHLALVCAVLVGLTSALHFAIRQQLRAQLRDDLERTAALAAVPFRAGPRDASGADALADSMGSALGARVTVIDAGGAVLGDSEVPLQEIAAMENHAGRPEVASALEMGHGTATRFSSTLGTEMTYAAVALPDRTVIRIAKSTAQVDRTGAAIRRGLIATGAAAAALSVILALAVSGALAHPILELTRAARAMASGELERRIAPRAGDELGQLGQALNDLAESFAQSIRQVTAERNRLAGILASMVEGVLVVDSGGHVVLLNPSLREILGIQGDVAGRTVLEAIRSAELHGAVASVLGGGEPIARMLTVNGPPERTMEVRFSILRTDETQRPAGITGLVAVFHDVTELKRLEQVRRDFVANASHELKTPVSAILGASETLTDGAIHDEEAGPKFLSSISRNASRLAALVEDLLDLSRLESRGAGEALREVRPEEALARAATAFRETAEKKRIQVEVEAGASGLDPVRGDPALMERAISNLVQNAVRYTPEGGRVVLRAVKAPGGDAIRFEVTDTGIGIPVQALPRIWERFYRVDPARSRELGGTGLGLAIVKHAVESMGGTVSVQSVSGRGSTFSFTLPLWEG